jgi:hypothetical protein
MLDYTSSKEIHAMNIRFAIRKIGVAFKDLVLFFGNVSWSLFCLSISLSLSIQMAQAAAGVDPEGYFERYSSKLTGSNHLMSKITNNTGDGFEDLYGTRNMRAVLHGIYYRGGGNNYYHRSNPRDNMNPLPGDGLSNLCEEGFGKGIYFYSTNFKPANLTCTARNGGSNTLGYTQLSVLENSGTLQTVLSLVNDCIKTGKGCPVYGHCWNGWHASGLAAAVVLRQFCDFSPEEALQYWVDGTDSVGNSNYPYIKNAILGFQPLPEYKVDAALQARICPLNPYHTSQPE